MRKLLLTTAAVAAAIAGGWSGHLWIIFLFGDSSWQILY